MYLPLFEQPEKKKENPNLRWAKVFTQRALKEKPAKVKKQKPSGHNEASLKGFDRMPHEFTTNEMALVIGDYTASSGHFLRKVEKDIRIGICLVKKDDFKV